MWPRDLDVCPGDLDIWPGDLDICPQTLRDLDIWPGDLDIWPGDLDICPWPWEPTRKGTFFFAPILAQFRVQGVSCVRHPDGNLFGNSIKRDKSCLCSSSFFSLSLPPSNCFPTSTRCSLSDSFLRSTICFTSLMSCGWSCAVPSRSATCVLPVCPTLCAGPFLR